MASKKKPKTKLPKKPAIVFELEPDAEKLFLESLENIEVHGVPKEFKTQDESYGEKGARPDGGRSKPARGGQAGRAARGTQELSIDLHHCTVDEAKRRVRDRLSPLLAQLGNDTLRVKIITGKGRHSGPGGGVLGREIHQFVRANYAPYIKSIEDSPADLVVGELPIRGHFVVSFAKPR